MINSPMLSQVSRLEWLPFLLRKSKPLTLVFLIAGGRSIAQSPSPTHDALAQQVEQLASAVAQQQQQLKQSLIQISSLQQQVTMLQAQLAASSDTAGGAATLAQQVQATREQQEIQSAQLAIHEQTKVETESKFPLTFTGLILANAFHNTGGVYPIQSPTVATGDPGTTTGISLSQTVLGLDARGPHFLGAATHADVRVDFFGAPSASSPGSYGGYSAGLLRLRTAHVNANWAHAAAFVELDRPIFTPDAPTSLTAIAQPALSWSGNLWNWLPQLGGAYKHSVGNSSSFTLEAALMDVPDPPGQSNTSTSPVTNSASFSERSGWPGSEAHVAYMNGDAATGFRLGAGGYFSPHAESGVFHYDAWAATLDYRIPISRHFEATGAFYRGLALGGLGGGGYKDYIYTLSASGASQFVRPLDAVGGWSQIKVRTGQHLEWNAAYGLDDAFASELRPYSSPAAGNYANLVRNSTFFANAIYSPTAYTVLSFEYRRIDTTPVIGLADPANVYGFAAGYKF